MDGSILALPAVVTLSGTPGAGKETRTRPPEKDGGLIHPCAGDPESAALRAGPPGKTVRARPQAWRAQAAPLIAQYGKRGLLKRVDAMAPVADIRRVPTTIVGRLAR